MLEYMTHNTIIIVLTGCSNQYSKRILRLPSWSLRFSQCVSQKLVPEPREQGNFPANDKIYLCFLKNEEIYFKSSEFCSSLLIIQAGMLTRSELAGFKVLYTRHNNPLFIINHSWITTSMHYVKVRTF